MSDRVLAWDAELRAVHARLRAALDVARAAIEDGADAGDPSRDLLLYCAGFCVALDGHHRSEDGALFPAIVAERPDLAPVIEMLERDHSVLAQLIGSFRQALDAGEGTAALERHLEGIGAIMESHFRYEERQLLAPLAGLSLEADRDDVLGAF